MPQRKSAGSLHNTCLCFIAKNIGHWISHYEEHHVGQASYLHVLGPFNELNSQLAEDLMRVLIREQRLSRSSLHLLLYGRALRNLDLSSCSRIVNDEVAGIIASTCKILQKLDLSNCKRVTSTGFTAIATSLPHISTLYLTKTNLRSTAAQTIFKNCYGLQDLSLKHCQVGDQDLMVLCHVASSKRGTKLKRLNISYTLATESGVRSILRGMPHLQLIEYPSLLTCLFQDEAESLDETYFEDSGTYRLLSLQCQDFMSVSNEMLQAIPDLCPQLTKLDLRFAGGFNNAGLSHLAQLHKLKDLQLCCEESEDITFSDGILPVLVEIGANISVLSLQDIGGLDPVAVYQLCPNLKKLFLLMMKDGKVFGTDGKIPVNSNCQLMTGLKELDFWCRNGDTSLSEQALCFVLSKSITLESIGLIRVDSFTDSLLRDVLRKNTLNKLKQLSLHECHGVTEDTLSDVILSSGNQLQYVKLMNCLQVTRSNYETWEKQAKRENFDMKIDWK